MQLQHWDPIKINSDIQQAQNKFKKCVTITYKKGIVKTGVGVSVFVITVLAAYIFKTGIFFLNDFFRNHLLFNVTILTCSAFGSLYSIINGLGWLNKSRNIANDKNEKINYCKVNITILDRFYCSIKNEYIDNSNKVNAINELKKLSKNCSNTNEALIYKADMITSGRINTIKVKLNDLIRRTNQYIENQSIQNEMQLAQITISLLNVHTSMQQYIQLVNDCKFLI